MDGSAVSVPEAAFALVRLAASLLLRFLTAKLPETDAEIHADHLLAVDRAIHRPLPTLALVFKAASVRTIA